MTQHNLYYYPYSSFTDEQLPLLKVAALYFDKLYILDPVGAGWKIIGTTPRVLDALDLLYEAGILELVSPINVLKRYADRITEAIRADLGNPEFQALCKAQNVEQGVDRWTLSLAKVPEDLQTDAITRELLREAARQMGADPDRDSVYEEVFLGPDEKGKEYRCIDVPFAVGEAIMMNHAVFAGLSHSTAIPITDDPFHSRVLAYKLKNTRLEPKVEEKLRQSKGDPLAYATLMDRQINLPVLNPALSLVEVLQYREKHFAALEHARRELGMMARRIKEEPWSESFAAEIDSKIPDVWEALKKAGKARNSWLKQLKSGSTLAGAGAGIATAVLTLFAGPVASLSSIVVGLSALTAALPPGLDWIEARQAKKAEQQNGLHYLMELRFP